jgi:integrase/recombinase XerD
MQMVKGKFVLDAITASDINLIQNYDAGFDSRIYRSQQIFLFSYYCRGINFNDIVKLKETNFNGDIVRYKRIKNGRFYDFKLHTKAKAIVDILETIHFKVTEHMCFQF